MVNLLILFVYIAFFRASPSEVPAGRQTLIVAVAAVLLCNTVVTSPLYGAPSALVLAVLEVVISGVFLYGCLSAKQHLARFEQSFAALCGVGAVMALVAWPWILAIVANPEDLPQWVLLGQIALMMWSLLVWSRVLRLAGEFSNFAAAGLSLGYFFFSGLVFAGISPAFS